MSEYKEEMLENEDSLDAGYSPNDEGYPMYSTRVEKNSYAVYHLKRKYDKGNQLILDSDFQRDAVWTPAQKAELIESIFMGLPLPIFYLNQDKNGSLVVIDGRQRLTSLFEFMDDKWELKGLKVLKELNGKKFSDLKPVEQSQLEDYQLNAHVIQPPTPDKIKFDIFDRVNRGGTQLNKQEIRNALYQGKATALLKKVVQTPEFAAATENAFLKNSRMKDRHIVLRYLAFYLYFTSGISRNGKQYVYKDDIDELLGYTMEYINGMPKEEVEKLYQLTLTALRRTTDILGADAFRRVNEDGKRSPINMNIFETIMYLMSKVKDLDDADKEALAEKIIALKSDKEYLDAIGNHRDNNKKITIRFKMMDKILEG